MSFKTSFAGVLLVWAQFGAAAAEPPAGAIGIERPQARATAAGQSMGGAYLTLVNRGAADRLVSARVGGGLAGSVELHTMSMQGDVMRMRQLDAIDLPAGGTVELKPGGDHLMLVGLKAPLKAGATFALTLKFERAGELTVQVPVKAVGADHGMKH